MPETPENALPPFPEAPLSASPYLAELIRSGLDLMDQGIAIFDNDLCLAGWNQAFLDLLEYPASLARPGTPYEAFMRFNAERGEFGAGDLAQQVEEKVRAARQMHAHERLRHRPNGQVLKTRGIPLPGRGFVMLYTDVTAAQEESRKAAEALGRSEKRLKTITDAIPAHIAYFDADWIYRYANRSYANWFGLNSEQIVGLKISDAIGELYASIHDQIRLALAGEEVTYEYSMIGQDGKLVTARSTLLPDLAPDGRVQGCFVHSVDITEQRRTQSAFAQAQKMEAIGQLTGGLAHDFNNMLTVVMGNLNGLREQCADKPNARPLIDSASEAASAGADLIRRLLAFARQQPIAPTPVDANELVIRLTRMIRRSLPENISFVTALASKEPITRVDPNQMENALLNLVLNARDALPTGGELRVETGFETLESRAAADLELTPGDYIRISVTDNGTGMDGATLSRVFEPFFTTKTFGKGSGLGLSMVYGFIRQSGGGVRIRSRQAVGTTVTLLLPCYQEPALTENGPDAGESEMPLRGKLVLLVDDVEEVRKVVRRQLADLGCMVIEAESGHEAADMVENIPAIALVLTDVVMPGTMDGRTLARFVRRFRPEVPVVLMSGYAEKVATWREDDALMLLEKPFDETLLQKTLRHALLRADRDARNSQAT